MVKNTFGPRAVDTRKRAPVDTAAISATQSIPICLLGNSGWFIMRLWHQLPVIHVGLPADGRHSRTKELPPAKARATSVAQIGRLQFPQAVRSDDCIVRLELPLVRPCPRA